MTELVAIFKTRQTNSIYVGYTEVPIQFSLQTSRGLVWFGMVWWCFWYGVFGMVWYGLVWFGMVWWCLLGNRSSLNGGSPYFAPVRFGSDSWDLHRGATDAHGFSTSDGLMGRWIDR